MKMDYNEKVIRCVLDEINLPETDLTDKVKAGIKGEKSVRRVPLHRAIGVGIAIIMVTAIFAYHAPAMASYAKEVIGSWLNVITTDNEQIKMEGEYHELKTTASKEENRYQTLGEIEDMLGVELLQSTLAYEGKERLIWYSPYYSENSSKGLYGAVLIDDAYILGDLKNVKIKDYADIWTVPEIQFDRGDKYQSAISCQITIRSNLKPDKNYENQELEYSGIEWDYPKGTKSETYISKNLNTKVVLVPMDMDGGKFDSAEDRGMAEAPALAAHFVYDGIEYEYTGRVSMDTMKEVIETLK